MRLFASCINLRPCTIFTVHYFCQSFVFSPSSAVSFFVFFGCRYHPFCFCFFSPTTPRREDPQREETTIEPSSDVLKPARALHCRLTVANIEVPISLCRRAPKDRNLFRHTSLLPALNPFIYSLTFPSLTSSRKLRVLPDCASSVVYQNGLRLSATLEHPLIHDSPRPPISQHASSESFL